MKIKDRIKELRRVKASELLPHPANWRTHPQAQQDAMRGVLAEIGWADAALVRETPDGLQLIDGHLRDEIAGDGEIPVLVLDLTEAEALKLLGTHDPLADMVEVNEQALGELLAQIETDNDAVQALLDGLAEEHGIDLCEPGTVDMPDLPSGDREPFQQMTFTLSDEQAGDVKRAMDAAKKAGPFVDTGNENSNGNALARIVEAYLGTG